MKLLVGARNSALSRVQAYEFARVLKTANPELCIEYRFRDSLGDVQRQQPLSQFAERGVFTEDSTRSLVAGEIDIAVHSWKDLPTAENEATLVAATLRRADCRDLVIFPRERILAQKGRSSTALKILTSSPRREFNLTEFLSWALPLPNVSVEFVPVRGNVDTRIQKLLQGTADGLVVAKAAIDRLLSSTEDDLASCRNEIKNALEQCLIVVVPLSISPAAAAQGALAAEILRDRNDLRELLAKINDRGTFEAVLQEREFLSRYGGGCQQKIGITILSREYGEVKFLRGTTDEVGLLGETRLTNREQHLPKAQSVDKIWPAKDSVDLFDREELEIVPPQESEADGYWISRIDALPPRFAIPWHKPVWTAGLATWKKLVMRGVWVTGSAEGLGESEDPQLSGLLPALKRWIKFTHADGTQGAHATVSTYRLIPRADIPRLDLFTHFFWKSGSALKLALEKFPALQKCWHGCGPGNTFLAAKSLLRSAEKLRVYLSFEDFLREVTP